MPDKYGRPYLSELRKLDKANGNETALQRRERIIAEIKAKPKPVPPF